MYVCVYIYTHIHIHTRLRVYTKHSFTLKHIHTYTHTFVHVHILIYSYLKYIWSYAAVYVQKMCCEKLKQKELKKKLRYSEYGFELKNIIISCLFLLSLLLLR